jgi:general stress protein 26
MTDTTSGTTSGTSSDVAKVAELIKGFRFAMLTSTDSAGKLVSRPMTVQETEFDGNLWFIVSRTGGEVAEITANPIVNASFSSNDTWVSLSGTAEVVDDTAKLKDLWNKWVEAWFPNGPEDPDVTLIKVTSDSAEYWDSPGGRVASAFSFIKSKVTGETYDGGENAKVEL